MAENKRKQKVRKGKAGKKEIKKTTKPKKLSGFHDWTRRIEQGKK